MFPIHPVRIAHGVWIAVLASVMLPVLLLAGCSREAAVPAAATAPPGVPVATDWPLPAPMGGAQPDLVRAPDGRLLLSWVEPAGERGHRLQLAATLAGETGWAPTLAVAEGEGWFVNWADTPRVQALADGSLWAHWLERTGPSRMDYGIALVRSDDGGRHWQRSAPVHPRGRGDHGFTTFWAAGDDRLGLAWLDSRQKAAAGETEGHDGHHGGAAAMMLRAAVHGPDGVQQAEWPLDASTCDCCTTASAQTARGVVVVYRGRGAGEIRDTRIVRLQPDGTWTAPRDVHRDGWRFPGCPVNGPAVAAEDQDVWVAWYTEADAVPELRLAHSRDAGGRFDPPVVLARGPQVLGRVALALIL